MIYGMALLAAVTVLYAGYNIFIRISGGYVPESATTTIVATLILQLSALLISLFFLSVLATRGGHVFALSNKAYFWAAIAGLCIGSAEIAYFYLFSGIGSSAPIRASIAIPVIVGGTIVLSALVSVFALRETIAWNQMLGIVLITTGIAFMFLNSHNTA